MRQQQRTHVEIQMAMVDQRRLNRAQRVNKKTRADAASAASIHQKSMNDSVYTDNTDQPTGRGRWSHTGKIR